MKAQIIVLHIENFIFHFADGKRNFTLKDMYDWIDSQYDGIRPERNKFFELRNVLLGFTCQPRDGCYSIAVGRVEKFFENDLEKLKKFRKQYGE